MLNVSLLTKHYFNLCQLIDFFLLNQFSMISVIFIQMSEPSNKLPKQITKGKEESKERKKHRKLRERVKQPEVSMKQQGKYRHKVQQN